MSQPLLVDTSAAVALLLVDHEAHDSCFEVLSDRELGLSGHAAFETYSVLTRLPGAARRSPRGAAALLAANFPATTLLSAERASSLLDELAVAGIAGGAVYDALVGAAAVERGLVLASRDSRAADTYRSLGVEVLSLP